MKNEAYRSYYRRPGDLAIRPEYRPDRWPECRPDRRPGDVMSWPLLAPQRPAHAGPQVRPDPAAAPRELEQEQEQEPCRSTPASQGTGLPPAQYPAGSRLAWPYKAQ